MSPLRNSSKQELSTVRFREYCSATWRKCLSHINDRIAMQRYLTPKIPIGSPVMSRTTSEPSGGRSRKMVAIVAGCRSFRTFRDYHTSIAFTTVGAQPNLAHIFGYIWDRFRVTDSGFCSYTNPSRIPRAICADTRVTRDK